MELINKKDAIEVANEELNSGSPDNIPERIMFITPVKHKCNCNKCKCRKEK